MDIAATFGLVALMVALVVDLTFVLHPFFALWISGFVVGMAGGLSPSAVLLSLSRGFGATVGKVGVIIVSGAVIGCCLERSGAAMPLAKQMLHAMGERHALGATSLVGAIVAMAVFADCGLMERTRTRTCGAFPSPFDPDLAPFATVRSSASRCARRSRRRRTSRISPSSSPLRWASCRAIRWCHQLQARWLRRRRSTPTSPSSASTAS
eukprot:701992-Prymnesium_polylepis.1